MIYDAARAQLGRVDLARPVRLTGVSVSGFAGATERGQLGLFAPASERSPEVEKRRALNAALDRLTERFGDRTVQRADLAERDSAESDSDERDDE